MFRLFAVFIVLTTTQFASAECYLERGEITKSQDLSYQTWEFEDSDFLWSNIISRDSAISDYQQAVSEIIHSLDPFAIIEKQTPIFIQDPRPSMKGEVFNSTLVLQGKAGYVRDISCLESLMVQEQTALFPLATYPHEFLASIFKKVVNGKSKVKVVLRLGVTTFQKPVESDILNSVSESWIFWGHIHNHPFELAKYPDQIFQGLMAPSLSDVQMYRNWFKEFGLQRALITNGFHTIEISSKEFNQFCSWDDEGNSCFL